MYEIHFRVRGGTVCAWITLVVSVAISCQSQMADNSGSTNVSTALQSRDFCQLETFQANCSGVVTGGNAVRSRSRSLEVIYFQSARYGRMHIGRCVTRDYGHVGCAVDVLSEVDALCSGRLKTCQFPVSRLHSAASASAAAPVTSSSHETGTSSPCPGDLTSYLEASFVCLPVVTATSQQACRAHIPLLVTSRSGYLASAITIATGQGGRDCPWRIHLPAGQRVNITLINFFTAGGAWFDSVHATPTSGSAGRSVVMTIQPTTRPNACYQLATFREGMDSTEVARSLTECEGGPRISHAYMSESNVVDVEILVSRNQLHRKLYFLLQFEAVGCSTLALLQAGITFLRRDAVEARVQCNSTKYEWTLYCHGTTWSVDPMATAASTSSTTIGDYCSVPATQAEAVTSTSGSKIGKVSSAIHLANIDRTNFPYSILAVVTVGVALGVVVGGILLICSARYFKKYQDTTTSTGVDYYGSTDQHTYHYDRPAATPMTAFLNGDVAGSNITTKILTIPNCTSKRQRSYTVTSRPSFAPMTLTPHVALTSLQADDRNADIYDFSRHHHHHHRCHDDQLGLQPIVSTECDVDNRPSNVTRVVCCGTVRKVEPVSPRRRPVCETL